MSVGKGLSAKRRASSAATTNPRTPGPKPRQRSNRFGLLNDFRTHSLRHVSTTAGVIWLLLWSYADTAGIVRMMSRKRIAGDTGLSEETVKRAIKELSPRHLVRVGGGTTGHTSVYRLRAGTEVWREAEGGGHG